MKSKKFPSEIWFETIHLQDKKSGFRPSEPDQYILQIMARTKTCGSVILREFTFPKKEDMQSHLATIRGMFE